MKTEQPATAKGLSTRDRVLEAARRALIDRGYEAFVLREIAEELDMKLGNLQYYFKTREALVIEVMKLESIKDQVTIRNHMENSKSPADALDAVVSELVSRWRSKSGALLSTLSTLSLHNKSYRKLYRDIYLEFYDCLEELLQQLNPSLSDEEIKLRTRMITALIDGSAMQIRSGRAEDYLAQVRQHVYQLATAN